MVTIILICITVLSCAIFLLTILSEIYSTHINDRKIADLLKQTARASILHNAWNKFAFQKHAAF